MSVIFGAVIWPKNWHFGLCCLTNGDMQRKSGVRFKKLPRGR